MTKAEAIEYVTNSNNELFKIQKYKKNECDACKRISDYTCEFTISAKHLGDVLEGMRFKLHGKQRITKHICTMCFIRLFPDEVITE